MAAMPSWNIHTAHIETLLASCPPEDLGIQDVNAFLFGSIVPDIYVGFMVPEASLRVDYCITHMAQINMIPVANADLFWDLYLAFRTPTDPTQLSLALGAWAHLLTDRYYNGNFRSYWLEHDIPGGDAQRIGKQADFELFGHSLSISSLIQATPELLQAAYDFRPYRILEEDAKRSIAIANAIVSENAAKKPANASYQMISEAWLWEVFHACDERTQLWLRTWQRLVREGKPVRATDIRAAANLAPATPDVFDWAHREAHLESGWASPLRSS